MFESAVTAEALDDDHVRVPSQPVETLPLLPVKALPVEALPVDAACPPSRAERDQLKTLTLAEQWPEAARAAGPVGRGRAEAEVLAAQAFLAQLDPLLVLYDENSRDAWQRVTDPRGRVVGAARVRGR